MTASVLKQDTNTWGQKGNMNAFHYDKTQYANFRARPLFFNLPNNTYTKNKK